jgi:hypothetical protein
MVAEALDEGGAPREASAEEAENRCGKRAMGMSLEHHHDVITTSSGDHQEVIRRSSAGHQQAIKEIFTWREGKLLRVHAQVPDEGGQPGSSEKP